MSWKKRLGTAVGFIVVAAIGAYAYVQANPEEAAYTEVYYEVSPEAAAVLDMAYSIYGVAKPFPEYAYCITTYRVQMLPDSTPLILIDSVVPAYAEGATPQSVEYSCGPFPALHSHPPTDCEQNEGGKWECTMSANIKDLCEPSYTDVLSTLTDWHRFHGIQCGRDRFLFFVPDFIGS
jgi:hypothetical protein